MNSIYQLYNPDLWRWLQDKGGGVYKVIAIKEGKIIPQHRFLGTDDHGILYIGQAGRYTDRISKLILSIKNNNSSHICGRRYKKNSNIVRQFPPETLYIEIIQSTEPEILEKKLLCEYFEKYGEAPPLNAYC